MDICDRRELKNAAGRDLSEAACDPKRLVLIHTGAALALSLILMLLDYVLGLRVENTGGLGGVGTRSVLTTVRTVLQIGRLVALPAWEVGWLYVSLRLSRRQNAAAGDLAEGFRRFFPVLRLKLLKWVLYGALCLAACYLGTCLFPITPWAKPLLETAMTGSDPEAMMEAMLAQSQSITLPLMLICGALALLFAAPTFYRFRMAEYVLLDQEKPGAFSAMSRSRRMTRGSVGKLLGLDLSFWWFYLLEMLVAALSYGDMLLAALGVNLPWPAEVSYFVFYLLYALGCLLLYRSCKCQVSVTYAKAYEALSQPREPLPDPEPKRQPWDYQ